MCLYVGYMRKQMHRNYLGWTELVANRPPLTHTHTSGHTFIVQSNKMIAYKWGAHFAWYTTHNSPLYFLFSCITFHFKCTYSMRLFFFSKIHVCLQWQCCHFALSPLAFTIIKNQFSKHTGYNMCRALTFFDEQSNHFTHCHIHA